MKWINLKSMKCPDCGTVLNFIVGHYMCGHVSKAGCACGFKISKEKFDKIVNDLYKPKTSNFSYQDNSSDLNNLGHEVVREDFSDSPFL